MKYVVHCRQAPYDVYIGRPGPWGNPFRIGPDGNRAQVIQKFREYILSDPELEAAARRELKGKVLGCFCAPLPCHGDVLASIANWIERPSDSCHECAELNAEQIEREFRSIPREVSCVGCGGVLRLYGPNGCMHDEPVCRLFETACSHRIFELHQ